MRNPDSALGGKSALETVYISIFAAKRVCTVLTLFSNLAAVKDRPLPAQLTYQTRALAQAIGFIAPGALERPTAAPNTGPTAR